jgi:hypothetical protein
MDCLWYPLGITRKVLDKCLPTMRYLFMTLVVNLGNFSLLMLKLE